MRNGLDFYSGGDGFKTEPGTLLSCLRFFVVLLSPSRQIAVQYLDDHDRFL
jgi:hypothetical protein